MAHVNWQIARSLFWRERFNPCDPYGQRWNEKMKQEQHLLDSDCTVCDMLLEGSSPKAFLTTDGGWKHAAETKWADASRLK
jgi:hypothetical protein